MRSHKATLRLVGSFPRLGCLTPTNKWRGLGRCRAPGSLWGAYKEEVGHAVDRVDPAGGSVGCRGPFSTATGVRCARWERTTTAAHLPNNTAVIAPKMRTVSALA